MHRVGLTGRHVSENPSWQFGLPFTGGSDIDTSYNQVRFKNVLRIHFANFRFCNSYILSFPTAQNGITRTRVWHLFGSDHGITLETSCYQPATSGLLNGKLATPGELALRTKTLRLRN